MAYLEKYSGNWESLRGYSYDVVLYQDTAVSGAKDIRVKSVNFRYTKNDHILVSSVDVVFENTYTFAEFEDLLTNENREWQLLITAHGARSTIYFQGYLVVDVNERTFARDKGSIRITASDELLKMKDQPVTGLTSGSKIRHLDTIQDGLATINAQDLYINSALFYKEHDMFPATATANLFRQTYLDVDFFYKNNIETKSYWDVINDICKTYNCLLYVYKNKYYLERYNDLERTDNWVRVDAAGSHYVLSSQYTEYTKQDDFDYREISQALLYQSGLSKYTVNVDPQPFLTIVPNAWDTPLAEYSTSPNPKVEDLTFQQWYIDSWRNSGYAFNSIVGSNNFGMSNYIRYSIDRAVGEQTQPLLFAQWITFNTGDSTVLKLKWKALITSGWSYDENTEWTSPYRIRKSNTGASPDYYIIGADGNVSLDSGAVFVDTVNVITGAKNDGGGYVEFSTSLELNDIKSDCDSDEKLLFFFYPPKQTNYDSDGDVTIDVISDPVLFGDFEISVGLENADNQFEYEVNTGFINTDEISLNIFDNVSNNVRNGAYYLDGEYLKTDPDEGWTDNAEDNNVEYDNLINHHTKSVVGYEYKTRLALDTRLIFKTEIFLKPLAFLNDNNLTGYNFVVEEYILDMVNSVYTITGAKEYSDEKGDIIII